MSKRLRSSYVCADCSGPGELHWPGPLPSAFLTRTPVPGPPLWVGRVPAAEPHTPCPTSRPGGTGAALGPESSGPVRAGRTGGRRPPDPLDPPSLLVSSVPGRAGRRRAPGSGLRATSSAGRGWGNPQEGQLQKSNASVLLTAAPRGCRCVSPSCLPHRYLELRSVRGPCPEWATCATSLDGLETRQRTRR